MSSALGAASPAWRAGRASAALKALMAAEAPADDVLPGLHALGTPPQGWWDVVAAVRAGDTCALLLPRPGDPRGLALPRDADSTGAVGWIRTGGSTWLLPVGECDWHVHEADGYFPAPVDIDETARMLRGAIVAAAHVIDALETPDHLLGDGARRQQERLVDSWILGPPPLPMASRPLAALGLRMLLAVEAPTVPVDTRDLETSARSAVEAAYSSVRAPG